MYPPWYGTFTHIVCVNGVFTHTAVYTSAPCMYTLITIMLTAVICTGMPI